MSTMMEPLAPWLREINRLLTTEGTIAAFVPPADVLVDDDGVSVYMDVPGLTTDNLEIELEHDTLTVRGERPFPYTNEGRALRRIERGFGRFERSLRVPTGLDPASVEASLSDGVLSMRIPKPEQLRPRRVEIREGESQSSQQAIPGTAQPGRAQPAAEQQPAQPQSQPGDGSRLEGAPS
jgi:HSP20 family protein